MPLACCATRLPTNSEFTAAVKKSICPDLTSPHEDLLTANKPSMTHASTLISGLRSVSLYVPDLRKARDFYTGIWNLQEVCATDQSLYLRGTGTDHHLLSLHQSDQPAAVREITLLARSEQALGEVAQRTRLQHGTRVLREIHQISEPGGGQAIMIQDPHGRVFSIVHGAKERSADAHPHPDRPVRLAHAVLNSHDVDGSQKFFETVLDFSLADRTKIMAFMRCNNDHHSVAFGITDNDALNHIAFLMPDLDSVMRGGGRMQDAGYPIQWGPGRHGPGNNAFNYFIGPFGEVIEYTADVQQVDDSYQARYPDHWGWPPGRSDQWGIATPPSPDLKQAQRNLWFRSVSE